MIFTSSVKHAEEILRSLPPFISAMVVGDTEGPARDEIIEAFKNKELKFLVNVSVLTTGFDAPHVDLIAILRPTESVSLYQQIVGRGLRLSPNKTDCLILDYTGQGHNIFSPEIAEDKPTTSSVAVEVTCPACGLINDFWGLLDEEGELVEHFGRKCQGASVDPKSFELLKCGYRFRFKRCDQCGHENDIAARTCQSCQHLLVDNDKKLKEAMSLKDAHVMRVDTMTFTEARDKKGNTRLEICYYDVDAEGLKEFYYLDSPEALKVFYFNFTRMHNRIPEKDILIANVEDVLKNQKRFRMPMFVIARKKAYYWEVREKVF
jgi:DNA repair protein RadD